MHYTTYLLNYWLVYALNSDCSHYTALMARIHWSPFPQRRQR